jgi:glycosyltransferase involved in cell wall biosynthesis
MKILFIVPYYKPAYVYGGPIVVIAMLAERLVLLGHDVTIYTTNTNGKDILDVTPNQSFVVDGVKVVYFDRTTGDNTYACFALWKHLRATVKSYDVVHIHTWWNFLVLGSALICKNNGIKPIISPHGMLSDYILNKRNAFFKRWLHILIGKKLLENSLLHVSTQMEMGESVNIIPGWKGEIIPNLVKLSDNKYPRPDNKVFTVGFLSRVDPKKGLDVLIKALSNVDFDYQLQVAGSGDEEYVNSLKQLSVDYRNSDKITWVGWKNGEDKFSYLANLDLFALTSHSENFAIVVIESLSVGTPVMISNNVGLFNYVEKNDFGWITDMDIEHVTDKLNHLYKDKLKLERINLQTPATIAHEYEQSNLTNQYLAFYNKAINKSAYH